MHPVCSILALGCLLTLTPLSGAGQPIHNLDLVGALPGTVEDTAVAGDLVYCATWGGLLILDLQAQPVGFLPLTGWSRAVDAAGGVACVAADGAGLHVVDVSDPSSPRLLATCTGPQRAFDVALGDDVAFVSDQAIGLCVVTLRVPHLPVVIGSLPIPGDLHKFACSGDLLYTATDQGDFRIINVADPAAPVLLGHCDTPGSNYGLAVAGSYAYVSAWAGRLLIIDVSSPSNPILVGTSESSAPGRMYDVDIAGAYAYAAFSDGALSVFDLSTPAAPIELGMVAVPGFNRRVTAAGDLALVSSTYNGLHAIDATDPQAPVEAWFFRTAGLARGASIIGDYALVPGGYSSDEKSREGVAGLLTVNLGDLAHPKVDNFYTLSGPLMAVDRVGNLAGTLDWYGGFTTFDVSSPTVPIPRGACSMSPYTYDLRMVNRTAYVAGEQGLYVLDLSDEANPHEVGFLHLYEGGGSVALQDSRAYVTSHWVNLYIVDVADPAAPVLAGSLTTPSWSEAVAVSGDLAFLACGIEGMIVVDVANPAAPQIIGSYDTPGYACDVAVGLPYVYIADREGGITVCEVSDPFHPVATAWYRTALPASVVDLQDDLILVGSDFAGFFILRQHELVGVGDTPAPAFTLGPAVPNPFHRRSTIAFQLAAPARVTLTIHDVIGRHVRSLLAADARGPGAYTVTWDGRDDRGRTASAGTYFSRLSTAAGVRTAKMTLVGAAPD